jgi:hypothetical protein
MNVDYLAATFWDKVDTSSWWACWTWQQSTGGHLYGQTWDGQSVLLAHRVAYTIAVGPIPDDMTVHHRCYNRRCVNPLHLGLLTNTENAADNGNARKTSCPAGHHYEGDNLKVSTKGFRLCKACARARRKVS